MIPIPGSLSFAKFDKLVMMSSAPEKCAGVPDTRPKIHEFVDRLSHTISTPIFIRSAFFLHRTQKVSNYCLSF